MLLTFFTTFSHAAPSNPPDTMAERVLACVGCHGKEGRATNDGYYPRIAGKPEGYLYNQLLNFRDGHRRNAAMVYLVDNQPDTYLREIAAYFAALKLPYPPPKTNRAAKATLERGRQLVTHGDAAKKIPACASCHGKALTGVLPSIPGLLGLPHAYLYAQLSSWKNGARHAASPDCMARVTKLLSWDDISAVATYLASQAVPGSDAPAAANSIKPAFKCGSFPIKGGASSSENQGAKIDVEKASEQIARGKYLALAGNCAACHTTRGGTPYAGGRSIETSFGSVFSSNLTPDKKTGLGDWTSEDFWQAMHHGKSKDGHLLYPAFPYPNYTKVTRDDTDALFVYLQSLPPVEQANRKHALRFPYDNQFSLAVWRTLYFNPGEFKAEANQSAEWNRGAYLVQGLGHCNACHTRRDKLGGSDQKADLAGGLMPMSSWYASSLTSSAESGLGNWKKKAISDLLKTGVSERGAVFGQMSEVVYKSLQHLSDNDVQAIAEYLKSLPQTEIPAQASVPLMEPQQLNPIMAWGAKVYKKHCESCHEETGAGKPPAYPALSGSHLNNRFSAVNTIRLVLNGGYPPGTAGNPRPYGMPPFRPTLDDEEVAAVVTYTLNSWGNKVGVVTPYDVNFYRSAPVN